MSDHEKGRYEDTDAILSETIAMHPLGGLDVARLINDMEDVTREPAFADPDDDAGDSAHLGLSVAREQTARLRFRAIDDRIAEVVAGPDEAGNYTYQIHWPDGRIVPGWKANMASLRQLYPYPAAEDTPVVMRSLPPSGDGLDDDEGSEAAAVEHAARARYAEPGEPVLLPGDVIGLGPPPTLPAAPGRDPLAYLRAELDRVARTHRHYAEIARDHERGAHEMVGRLMAALAALAAHDDGIEAVGRLVGLVEMEAEPHLVGRFYAERVEPYRFLVEDTDTVTSQCNCVFPDIALMAAAFLNGDLGAAAAHRLDVLGRLDGVKTAARKGGGA